jgi:hypothetical protein
MLEMLISHINFRFDAYMKYPATLPMPTILPAQAVPDSC